MEFVGKWEETHSLYTIFNYCCCDCKEPLILSTSLYCLYTSSRKVTCCSPIYHGIPCFMIYMWFSLGGILFPCGLSGKVFNSSFKTAYSSPRLSLYSVITSAITLINCFISNCSRSFFFFLNSNSLRAETRVSYFIFPSKEHILTYTT